MIYNPLYKDNPQFKIQIYDGAVIYVWETLEDYLHTAGGGERTTCSLHRAIAGIYWVNTVFRIPVVSGSVSAAVCLCSTPQIRYATNSMDTKQYIAWAVLDGEYTVLPDK